MNLQSGRMHATRVLVVAFMALLSFGKASPVVRKGVIAIADTTDTKVESRDVIDYRLPTTLSPESYDILLTPYIDSFTFDGVVDIFINVINDTSLIILHANELNISDILVTSSNGDGITVSSTSWDSVTHFLTISLGSTLTAGSTCTVKFTFLGQLNDDMVGFYRSSYTDADGTTRWLATTQFQATYARQAFPCFDEPGFKAKFTVRINRPEDLHAISNMPLNYSSEASNGRVTDVFQPTVVMSSYLLAFIVSDFASMTSSNGNFTVWARSNAIDQAEYSLSLGNPLLAYFTEMTGHDYPLAKMDMAALSDFSWGAMENWGLVTYRETAMLYDENHSSATAQARVATVVAHELAHMWFGNLITLAWWDYAWLNEGFARRYQYMATHAVETNWSLQYQFLVEQHQVVLQNDGLESAHALSTSVSTPSEIASHFDTISYNKGASVIRMMENVFGKSVFEAALHDYIEAHLYGSVEPDDLWDAIQGQVDANSISLDNQKVKTIMDTWTTQPGHPVITVNFNRSTGSAEISQERFLLRATGSSVTNLTWWVPITWTTKTDLDFETTTAKYWLGSESQTVQVNNGTQAWILFNVQETGFYRVNYDDDSWSLLISALNSDDFESIHVLNRAQIIDDILNLARAGYVDYGLALDATQYLVQEGNYIPWKSLFNAFDYLSRRFLGQDIWDLYATHVLTIIDNMYNILGFEDIEGEDRLDTLNRRQILDWACNFGHKECISKSIELFAAYKANTSQTVSPNQRTAVYCTALKHGDSSDWQFLWEQYLTANVAAEQIVILQALGCSQNETVLQKYLSYAVTGDEGIRAQDSSTAFAAVYAYGGLVGIETALDFVRDHYREMETYYGSLSSVSSILSGISLRLSTVALIDRFSDLIDTHASNLSSIITSLNSQLTLAKYELNWYEENLETISSWLSEQYETTVDYRLPTTIYPETYDVYLSPYLDDNNFTFDGVVTIVANVLNDTNQIVLQYDEITIGSLSITVNSTAVEVSSTAYDSVTSKYTITLASTIKAGNSVVINITYVGILNNAMKGFYRSSYVNANGETRWLAATQFEPTSARRAIPCFDEPAFKAKFTIHIQRPENYTSISNMPLASSAEAVNGRVWDTFEQSVLMSSFLVAFVVSDFDVLTNSSANFNVWARPNAIYQAEYALDFGPKVLSHFEDFLDLKYQISKMDMIAIPDFSAGAMENWGLVTYRETAMLYDEDHSSASAQQRTSPVIAHECAHMWFGNLVSPSWWNVIWLSEAFARYYQYIAAAKVETTWKLDQQFVVEQHQVVFATDALESSQPMTNDVSSPSEISGNFGTITYSKGASVVRMMEKFFGSELFNAALHNYLNARQYSTAEPGDLWEALQTQVDSYGLEIGSTVETIMTSWTDQTGFPVVTVSISNGIATLEQERFLLRGTNSSTRNVTWWVPITWTSESNPDFETTAAKYWLSDESATVQVNNGTAEWIVFNIQEAGYYRVNYDNSSWYRIINHLNSEDFEDIHELNRAAIVDDLLNLARGGYLHYNTTLDGLQFLTQETNYLPFKAAFTSLAYLNRRFAGQDGQSLYATHMLALIDNIYNQLGFEDQDGDDRLTILLRREVLSWACNFGHTECISKSLEYFADWRANSSKPVPKNQRTAVYCSAIKYGSSQDWTFLYQEYLSSNVAAEQSVILTALGCSENTTILYNYLNYAISEYEEHGIRSQDSTTVFAAVYAAGLFGAEYTLDFVNENYENMYAYYGSYSSIASIISGASARFATQELVDKLELFIDTHRSTNLSTIISSVNSYLTLAKYELEWYESNAPTIISWLDDLYAEEDTSATTDYRLSTNIIPETYDIYVTPYLEVNNFTFDGIVKIVANVVNATQQIILHANEITYHQITVEVGSTEIEITNTTYDVTYHFIIIQLGSTLAAGSTINIEIVYTGILNTEMRGFYRSSYTNAAGETRWLASTHLEPVGARKMFPCFDEPALKAKFIINVNRPEDYHAISNMPLNYSSEVVDGRVWDTFQQSVTMSTYLVALIVSDFSSLSNETANFSVWARPNAIDQAEYALSIGPPIVSYMEGILGHEYQLPKLDMAALPDFASGAMENWGLLTYRENRMLFDADHTTTTSKQSAATVIAHEIAHQWFGDLVSPLWWKYLWLNEGFARYFQYFGTSPIETTWGLESQFVVEQLQVVFASDALTSTHPMTYDVYNPTQIRGIFDSISYAKAGSVIRMMEKSFGSTLFFNALHDYLEARQYGVAVPEDLWEAFQGQINATGFPLDATVTTIMDTWVTQSGFPVVNVTIDSGVATLSQERFLLRNTANVAIDDTWWVPITWTTESDPDFATTTPKYWLSNETATIDVTVGTDEWIIFNVQESGYYRVNYDSDSWGRIIATLRSDNFKTIHELNRAAIIDDLINLARIGYVDYKTLLNTTQYLVQETNYIPWRSAFNGFAYLNRRFNGRDIYEAYQTHVLTILDTIYEKLGFDDVDGEDYYDTLLRSYVLDWACTFGHEECIARSLELFAAWKADSSAPISPNQRSTVYCTAIKYGTSEDWEFLWQKYKDANVASEQLVILGGLGCSQNKTILHNFLYSAITESSGIRRQDSATVFSNVYAAGLFGAEYTLDFVGDHHVEMHAYYGDYTNIRSILSGISLRLSTQDLVDKFELFINTHNENLSTIVSSLKSYLTRAKFELTWYNTYTPSIVEWLESTYEISSYRLSTDITPETYDIYLSPYIEEGVFDGEVQITMNVVNATSKIVLHANRLNISQIIVYENAVNYLTVSSTHYNSTTHKLTIYLTTTLSAGTTIVAHILYTGILDDDMKGFYRSWYKDDDGNTRWIATTQFQPTHARRAFPCFDEPAFKAKFTINIERPNDYHTLSNMPWSHSVASDTSGRTWDSFEQSVPMSSYLVAIIVSDFDSIKNESESFSVWARPNAVEHAEYSLRIGPEILNFLGEYTNIAYPLAKMDMAAIPDFSAGAMENWGLVTYREYGLLSNDNVTSATYKKYINTIVAHELVHMWFGNLVTCEWWDYTWLNEGFAQYYQFVAGNASEPDWNLLQQFVVYQMHSAMTTDASASIRAMNNDVSTPDEISNGFDTIAYAKSASVIRMMQHSFGATTFAKALQNYLLENQYSTTNPDKLWAAIQTQVDADSALGDLEETVETLMNSWATQSGYPIVNASLNSGVLTLSQERFLLNRSQSAATDYTFWIPITYTTGSNPDFETTSPKLWFGDQSTTINLDIDDEWFIMNIQEVGYYRVNYDEDSWSRIITALKSDNFANIHELNRAQVIDDLLNLARSGYVDYTLALSATQYLTKESNHLPWKSLFNGITILNRRFTGQDVYELFRTHILNLIDNVYEELGFDDIDGEGQLNELNRQLILTWACYYEHEGCIAKAQELFAAWRADTSKWIPPNARPAVYCTALKYGTYEDWDFLWQQYSTTNFVSEQMVILNALGCTQNTTILKNYLQFAISTEDGIRRQDSSTVFAAVYAAGPVGLEATFDFIAEHYTEMYEYYASWSSVASIFSNVAARLSTQEQIDKFEAFVANNEEGVSEILSSLKSYASTANANLAWYNAISPTILNWLEETYEPTATTTVSAPVESAAVLPGVNVALIVIIAITPFLFNNP